MSWLGKWAGSTFGQWFGDGTEQQAAGPTWFQHVKFTAIQNAEAKVYGVKAEYDLGEFVPSGTAEPFFHSAIAGAYAKPWVPSTDAVAPFKRITVLSDVGWVAPETDATAVIKQAVGALHSGNSYPSADSTAELSGASIESAAGTMYPTGVQNLTEEELVLLTLKLSGKLN